MLQSAIIVCYYINVFYIYKWEIFFCHYFRAWHDLLCCFILRIFQVCEKNLMYFWNIFVLSALSIKSCLSLRAHDFHIKIRSCQTWSLNVTCSYKNLAIFPFLHNGGKKSYLDNFHKISPTLPNKVALKKIPFSSNYRSSSYGFSLLKPLSIIWKKKYVDIICRFGTTLAWLACKNVVSQLLLHLLEYCENWILDSSAQAEQNNLWIY